MLLSLNTPRVKWGAPILAASVLLALPVVAAAGQGHAAEVTFTKDIAPIVQRSCQNCHRSEGMAPMSLLTYEDVRPWARSIKQRRALRDKPGVMPPWFIEKDIGIQHFKRDPSLTEEEIAKIARWVDSGAPRGNPAHMPLPRVFAGANEWEIGTPDFILKTPTRHVQQTGNVRAPVSGARRRPRDV
jgi:mono/diheme cytochrome c family protein